MKNLLKNNASLGTLTEKYAAILGESPSQGAKSPVLWNQAFQNSKLPYKMFPFDVKSNDLEALVKELKRDRAFLGGAVTMPYKVQILPYLDHIEEEAALIGAVNCIYREGDKLVGTNTDGAGAIKALEGLIGAGNGFAGLRVLLIGLGGAGKAVATYLAKAIGPKGKLSLHNRTLAQSTGLPEKLSRMTHAELVTGSLSEALQGVDLLVNCSSVGFATLREVNGKVYSLAPFSPLAKVPEGILVEKGPNAAREFMIKSKAIIAQNLMESLEVLSQSKAKWVYDIVYQPLQTPLLSQAQWLGIPSMNGATMNLFQAAIAFRKAVSGVTDVSWESTVSSMKAVW